MLLVFGGLSLLAFAAFFSTITFEDQQQLQPQEAAELQPLTQFLGSFGIAVGAIILAVGVGYLVVSYGLLKGKGWARIVAVVLTIVAIVVQLAGVISSSVLSQSLPSDLEALASGIFTHIIGLAINGVILYYLYRPNVKEYFAKAQTY